MRIRLVAATATVVVVAAIAISPAGASQTATSVKSIPRVAAVFIPYIPGVTQAVNLPHECSASVVHSTHHNVVLTAAHCIRGSGVGYGIAPGYHDGVFPYGVWSVRHVYVNAAWKSTDDPKHDYAFLVVAPRSIGGVMKNIEDVVGAYPLGNAPPAGSLVTVDGYVAGSRDRPITCKTRAYRTSGYPSINCNGFADGTSGGPWLRNGAVVGVIGGLHQGGCTPSTSYSAPFGADARVDLARAEAGGPGDFVGSPGSDGCS